MLFSTVLRVTRRTTTVKTQRDIVGHCWSIGMLKETIASRGTFEVLKIDTRISDKGIQN